MPVVVRIIKDIIENCKEFYECKNCGKKGIYTQDKILCDECLDEQLRNFKEDEE